DVMLLTSAATKFKLVATATCIGDQGSTESRPTRFRRSRRVTRRGSQDRDNRITAWTAGRTVAARRKAGRRALLRSVRRHRPEWEAGCSMAPGSGLRA